MSRRTFSKAANSITLSKPNLTSVHIQQPRPTPLRSTGLQPVKTTPAPAVSAQPISQAPVITDAPVRNSTVRGGEPYTCPELRTTPYRAGSTDAFRLPSRTSFRNPQPA